MINETKYLTIPLGIGREAFIPLGMSEKDWELLAETLELWKPRIVAQDYVCSENHTLGPMITYEQH